MKIRLLLPVLISATTLLVASAGAADVSTKAGKPVLEKGMTAEVILQLIGKPAEVARLSSSDGKAERWTYRRVVDERTTQDAGTEAIPAFIMMTSNGPMVGTTDRIVPVFKHVKVSQVTSLLIYDGKLVLGRQWHEETRDY